jgi:hypothetical protein
MDLKEIQRVASLKATELSLTAVFDGQLESQYIKTNNFPSYKREEWNTLTIR